jgi:hypothetical protein
VSVNNQEKASPEWSTYPDREAAAADRTVDDHDQHAHPEGHQGASKHGGHRWMMLLMCLPLVAIGLWVLATGGGWGSLLGGLVCFGMMAVMHLGMGSSHKH